MHTGPPPKKRSPIVTVLAVIGAVSLLLIVLRAALASGGGDDDNPDLPIDYRLPAAQLAQQLAPQVHANTECGPRASYATTCQRLLSARRPGAS